MSVQIKQCVDRLVDVLITKGKKDPIIIDANPYI